MEGSYRHRDTLGTESREAWQLGKPRGEQVTQLSVSPAPALGYWESRFSSTGSSTFYVHGTVFQHEGFPDVNRAIIPTFVACFEKTPGGPFRMPCGYMQQRGQAPMCDRTIRDVKGRQLGSSGGRSIDYETPPSVERHHVMQTSRTWLAETFLHEAADLSLENGKHPRPQLAPCPKRSCSAWALFISKKSGWRRVTLSHCERFCYVESFPSHRMGLHVFSVFCHY